MSIDQWIVFYMNQVGGLAPWIDGAVAFFAEYFPYIVAVGFLYFAFRQRQHPLSFSPLAPTTPPRRLGTPPQAGGDGERLKIAAEGIGAGIVARVFVEVIRLFVHRPRPFVDNHAIVALLNETGYSFPSGHAAFFFALSTVVYIYNKRWGMWFFVASAVIGIARVVAGVHYMTDILGGAVLGIAVGYFVHRFFAKKQPPHLSLRLFHNPPL